MTTKMTRRALLAASLGVTQFALLEKLGMTRRAWADGPRADGPTKLLVLYIPGGVRLYPVFVPMSDAEITTTIPAPTSADGEPVFFRPADMVTLAGDAGGFTPLRMGRSWNPADPGDRTGYRYSPMGYGWVHYELGPTTAALHGIDMGSFAHGSAYIAAMCGVASSDYRSPAMVSVVANYLHQRYGTTRPIPCVAISSSGLPRAPGLPSAAAPTVVPDVNTLQEFFAANGMARPRWRNADARTLRDVVPFAGGAAVDRVGLTTVDAHVLARARALRGVSSAGTDAVLQGLHDSYVAVSRTLANDVVTAVQSVMPTASPAAPYTRSEGRYSCTFGLANGRVDMTTSCEWILRLLKSNITSTVFAQLPERYYDYHNGTSVPIAAAATRAQLDAIAQMLGELKATPSAERPGKTLYDDTLVVVLSEFNRSWMSGPDQSSPDRWQYPDDHNPIASIVLSGGQILGGRQIGGFEQPSREGLPVSIVEEGGVAPVMRKPRAADYVATVADLFGMRAGGDYFIPGGYGVIQGLVRA